MLQDVSITQQNGRMSQAARSSDGRIMERGRAQSVSQAFASVWKILMNDQIFRPPPRQIHGVIIIDITEDTMTSLFCAV